MIDWLLNLGRTIAPKTSAGPHRKLRRLFASGTCPLGLELLEARLTPATYTRNDGLATNWLIQRSGAVVEVLADGVVQAPSDPSGDNSITISGENGFNDSLTVNFANGFFALDFLFRSGRYPQPPYPDQGLDPTEDALGDCNLR